MKTCKNCNIKKPYDKFNKHPSMADGYLSKCKSCVKLYKRSYYLKNKEEILEKQRKPVGSQVGTYKSIPLDKRKQYAKTKYLNNRHDYIRRARERDQKLKESTPVWLNECHKQQIKDIYWLAKDLTAISGEDYHVDHIVPLRGEGVCGLHVPWNLQVLPADINLSKGNYYDEQANETEQANE